MELKPVNLKTPRKAASSRKVLPGIVRSLVLGHQFQRCLKEGQAGSFKQVGQQLQLTHARISQLLSLTLLAPDIQEEILLTQDANRIRLTEQKIRQIASEPDWVQQCRRWRELLNGRTAQECPTSRSRLTP